MLRLTLDTSSVIHAAQGQPYASQVDELVDLARQGQVGLWITTAFDHDQERAPADKHQCNLAWLRDRPLIGTVPSGARVNYSRPDIPAVVLSEEQGAISEIVYEILLPQAYQADNLRADEDAFMEGWRRKVNDVQHLLAHLIADHEAFVTSDEDDMLSKRAQLRARTGIVVVNPVEAVQMARGQSA